MLLRLVSLFLVVDRRIQLTGRLTDRLVTLGEIRFELRLGETIGR
jgi:hypothetical protein